MAGKRFLDKAYEVKHREQTLEMYEAWAGTYDIEVRDENDYRQPERCAVALKKLLPRPDVRIIDVGCGTGLSGLALQSHGFKLIDGCDFSPAMLKKATKTSAYRRLFQADLNHPPLDVGDGFYDAATVVGVFSFGHVNADAMDDILRVVRPDGFVVIGINQHFYDEGTLVAKLNALNDHSTVELLSSERGEHMPGTGTDGWVFVMKKN